MAFRSVPAAALAGTLLLLAAGCERQPAPDEGAATIPPDTVPLTAGELAELPRYGVQRLPCGEVRAHLESENLTTYTDTVTISLEGDSLVIDPATIVARPGDDLTWVSDDLVWVTEFVKSSPLQAGQRRLRGGRASPVRQRDTDSRDGVRTAVAEGEETCGRYYFLVAAYNPSQPDEVYVADPPTWIPE